MINQLPMIASIDSIDKLDTNELIAGRKLLHHAVQLPAMVGRSYSPPDPEDGWGNLGWSPQIPGFISHPVLNNQIQAALNPGKMELLFLSAEQQTVASTGLQHMDLPKAQLWMSNTLQKLGFDGSILSNALPYEITAYDPNCRFDFDRFDAIAQLALLYAYSDETLMSIKQQYPAASEARCWPHHFDHAALMMLETDQEAGTEKSIGWGFSPGDDSYQEPYFYVNCWPYPEITKHSLPALPYGGEWHIQGWTGTVLTYAAIMEQKDRKQGIMAYLKGSIASLQKIMG